LDKVGLVTRIATAAKNIDTGRKGFAIRGKEQEGRLLFEDGISETLSTFQEVQLSADPLTLLLAEYAYLTQELELTPKSDQDATNSLKKAIGLFDDAFLPLEIVDDKALYQVVEKTYSHDTNYRFKDYPKDAFHVACGSHISRIKNILKTPGLDPIEKALLKQRLANMKTAQKAYLEKQKKALS